MVDDKCRTSAYERDAMHCFNEKTQEFGATINSDLTEILELIIILPFCINNSVNSITSLFQNIF